MVFELIFSEKKILLNLVGLWKISYKRIMYFLILMFLTNEIHFKECNQFIQISNLKVILVKK